MRLPEGTIEAKTRSVTQNVIKTLLQTAGMWGFFLGVMPIAIASFERLLLSWQLPAVPAEICWGGFALFGSIGVYSGMLFAVHGHGTPLPLDTATRFIVLGPYRWVRNPMAIAGITQGIWIGLLLRSPAVLAYCLVGGCAWHFLARPWEERDLARRFGGPYTHYRDQVRNWIPCLRPYEKLFGSEEPDRRALA